jgi:predicted ATP-dependent protease
MSVFPLQITLCGVSPIGGIKEKVLGVHRAGTNRVVLPWANSKDVEHDVVKEVRGHIRFVFARTVSEALDGAFGPGSLPWHAADAHPLVESRLQKMGQVVKEREKQRGLLCVFQRLTCNVVVGLFKLQLAIYVVV